MSDIKAIEKLRKFVDEQFVTSGQSYLQGMSIANSIEAEIAERYMQLPEDVDCVPIHMGDIVEGELLDNSTVRGTVRAFHLYDDEPASVYIKVNLQGVWTIKELRIARCRHVKPRTVEDVLMDVMSDFADADFNDETVETITARYADEIRELLGGDAE